jgi:hypothetical protein
VQAWLLSIGYDLHEADENIFSWLAQSDFFTDREKKTGYASGAGNAPVSIFAMARGVA